jgi:hypothetical protein
MSMSPVLRPGPSCKIHTRESFFWFHKLFSILASQVFESAINESKILAAALKAGLMEQEQHYLCSAVLP